MVDGGFLEIDDGGGILNQGGTLTLEGVTIADSDARDGGGLFSTGGTVRVVDSTLGSNFSGRRVSPPIRSPSGPSQGPRPVTAPGV